MKTGIFKKILVSGVVLLLSVLAVNVLKVPKAASYNGYGCGVETGNAHSMAGLIVNVLWAPYGSAQLKDDNTSEVIVSTDSPSSTHDQYGNPANVARMTSEDSEGPTYGTVTFNQVNANCNQEGYVADLGYGQTSSATTGGDYWALDCDITQHPDHYQSFTVTGTGVPTGARAGGTWSSVDVAPPNGGTVYTDVVYTEPAPASSWTLTASSTVSRTTASPGDKVGFTHRITNNGPSTADSQYTVQQSANLPSYTIPPNESPNSGSVKAPKGGTMLAMEEDITVPSNATNGTRYCEWLTYNHGTGPSSGNASTAQACVTVSVSVVGGVDCPGDYQINNISSLVTINLPDKTPNDGQTDGYGNPVVTNGGYGPLTPSGSTTTPSETYDQDLEVATIATSAQDATSAIISGAATDPNIKLTPQTNYQQQTAHSASVNYAPYANDYPYDKNVASVTYYMEYSDQTYVTADKYHVSFYTCNSGDPAPDSNNMCTHTTKATSTYAATATTEQCAQGGLYNSGNGNCYTFLGTPPNCPSGYSPFYDSCIENLGTSQTYTAYACNPGDSGPDSSNQCTKSTTSTSKYDATANYDWQPNGSASDKYTGTYTTKPDRSDGSNAYIMSACYNRGFQVNSVSTGQPQYTPSTENPTGVTGGSGSVSVSYTVPASELRQPNQVTLRYTASYTIDKAGGAVIPYGNCSGTSGSVTADSSGSGSMGTSSCNVSIPTVQLGDQMCVQYSVTPTGYYMDVGGTPQSSDNPLYNNNSGYGNGQTMSSSVVCSSAIDNQPYARFYGNDVLAGSRFGSSGTCNTSAAITTYGSGTGPRATGSGSQFAAMSLGTISQFASAFLRQAAAPTSAKGLSFANTGSGVDNTYGGSFGSGCAQMADYYGAAGTPTTVGANTTFDVSGANHGGSNSLSVSGGSVQITGTNVSGSKVVYVDGNVYIPNDITYAPGGSFDPVTGQVSGVPSLYIVAKGNIYISPNVQHLDGIYVAQGDGSNTGIINTCAQSTGAFDPSSLVDNCSSNQLTVSGAFVASNVKFDRTFASVRNSTAGEESIDGNTIHDCGFGNNDYSNGSHPDCAAETFDFTPLNYLGTPAIPASGGSNTNTYDYITSLSPVL